MDFTLEQTDEKWVQETQTKAMEELRQTAPGGRAYAETVNAILEREKNWIKWKADLCQPFDKQPWSAEIDGRKVGLEEATRDTRKKMREPPKEWEWKLGSKALTDIWDFGYRDLRDLEMPFMQVCVVLFMLSLIISRPGDIKDFVKELKREEKKIELMLAKAQPPPPPIEPSDPTAEMAVDNTEPPPPNKMIAALEEVCNLSLIDMFNIVYLEQDSDYMACASHSPRSILAALWEDWERGYRAISARDRKGEAGEGEGHIKTS